MKLKNLLSVFAVFVVIASLVLTAPLAISASTKIVTVTHNRTIDEIVSAARALPHSGFDSVPTSYETAPSLTAPYSAGSLKQSDINDALNAVKMIRFLSGLPYENIKFTDELNSIAQHGAVLLAATNQTGHRPTQPDDMSDEFYQKGYQGCREANVHYVNSISFAMLDFMLDRGQSNIHHVGHRRWILKPAAENFGIGFAKNGTEYRVNMHVFDGLDPWETDSDSFIAWPASGFFPIQYFVASSDIDTNAIAPWSINLGAPYALPSKETATLTLTRKRDGKVWVFDNNTHDLSEGNYSDKNEHFSVNNDNYGMKKAIVFRPDITTLQEIRDGDIFTVELSGITYTDSSPATIKYDINFFDLDEALKKTNVTLLILSDGTPVANAAVQLDGALYKTDSEGKITVNATIGESYSCTITKAGYNTTTQTFTVKGTDSTVSISITPYTITKSSGKIKITIKHTTAERQGIVIGALYDNDTLIAADKVSGTKSSVTVTLPDKNATCIKLFHLNSAKSLVPLRESAVIPLQNASSLFSTCSD